MKSTTTTNGGVVGEDQEAGGHGGNYQWEESLRKAIAVS